MAMYCCASETLQEKRYHHVPSCRCSGLAGVEIVCTQFATGCFPPASAQCAVTTTLDDEEKEECTVKVGRESCVWLGVSFNIECLLYVLWRTR
jgi:hypothetical protein